MNVMELKIILVCAAAVLGSCTAYIYVALKDACLNPETLAEKLVLPVIGSVGALLLILGVTI